MFEKDKKNDSSGSFTGDTFKAPGSAKVIIGDGVRMKGEITSATEVQIDGDADINMETENLMVGQTGQLKGEIKTKNADIWGGFDGDLEVSSTLTIQEKGVVKGATKYSSLQIKLGGQLTGDVSTIEKPKIKAVPNPSQTGTNKSK